MMTINSKFFYGNEVSRYGQENGFVDYRTLAKAFDAVLNNEIISRTECVIGWWEQESGRPVTRTKSKNSGNRSKNLKT